MSSLITNESAHIASLQRVARGLVTGVDVSMD